MGWKTQYNYEIHFEFTEAHFSLIYHLKSQMKSQQNLSNVFKMEGLVCNESFECMELPLLTHG